MRPLPHGPPHVESRTELGYTVSASGTSSASPQGFVAEELSPIQSPDAHDSCERSGLSLPGADIASFPVSTSRNMIGRAPAGYEAAWPPAQREGNGGSW